jgi:hypothetical protein
VREIEELFREDQSLKLPQDQLANEIASLKEQMEMCRDRPRELAQRRETGGGFTP